MAMDYQTVKLEIYLPSNALHPVMEALAAAGAGVVGAFDNVTSYYPVQGSFRPLAGSQPYIGTVGKVHRGEEMKLEMRCQRDILPHVLAELRRMHPYEEPLVNILPLANGEYGWR